MQRTIAEIEAQAKDLDPLAIMTITPEEANALVHQHRANRGLQGKAAPDPAYVMKKVLKGLVKIHGRKVEVKDAVES